MTQHLALSTTHKSWMSYFQIGLAISAICSPLVLMATPVYANASAVFSSGNRGSASGRSRGGGVRDTRCLADNVSSTTNSSLNLDAAGDPEDQQIAAVLPGTEQATSQSTPSFLLYVPFDRHGDPMEVVFELSLQNDNAQRQVLESIDLLLPNQAGFVKFQLPERLALESGNLYDWSFRLKCSEDDVADSVETPTVDEAASVGTGPIDAGDLNISILAPTATSQTDTPRVGKVLQEVFGTMRLIEPPAQLLTAQSTPDVIDDYQAYVDNGMWLDLVPVVADVSSSDFKLLLAELNLDVDETNIVIEMLETK